MAFIRNQGCGRSKLFLCLVLAMMIAVGWNGIGRGESGIQTKNASGCRNVKLSVDPVRKSKGYSVILYDNKNGLPTSEANTITQTSEGFIWIGSYSGLVRYDGNTFERMDSSTGISNVRCLYVDSRDRLWIGTNDAGIHFMKKRESRKWDKSDGLQSVSIRAIAEDDGGVIYIASAAGIAMIDNGMNLTVLGDERIDGQTIRDIRQGNDGIIYGLTDGGDLFALKDGKLTAFLGQEECRVKGILALLPDPRHPGDLFLGTEDNRIYYGNLERNFASMGIKEIAPLNIVERMEYIDGQIWVCAGNGIGTLDDIGFHLLGNVPMNNSVGHVMTDYEGNLWFTSTRQGVMKIVPNRFSDVFEQCGLSAAVVNSTCMYGRQLFIATDSGLIVIEDGKEVDAVPLTSVVTASGTELEATDLLAFLNGVRIRSIIRDSEERLWISTWRRHGLIRYDHGKAVLFTEEDGLFSDQIRMVSECADGSMLVANTGGVSIIEGDRVTAGYSKADGIVNTEILTAIEGYDRELILGSDGDGIYVIGPEGTRRIGSEDGLGSEIILRIKRSASGDIYWIVTSNSLAYMTPDYRVTTIAGFPYPNNYDLYENSKGDAWVISSNGIYEIPVKDLLENESVKPVFYGIASGLPYVATANSFSELTSDGDLYVASTVGVVKVNIENTVENTGELKVALPYLDADGERYYPDGSGNFTVPGNVRKLTVFPRVFNYLLINPQVSFRLEGFDTEDSSVSRRELVPVDYTNLPNGTYQFVMRIKDSAGNIDNEVSFQIIKGKATSAGTAGSVIMDAASLFFMVGILIHTSLYRKRGRPDDRLFFVMIAANMVISAADMMNHLLEGIVIPGVNALLCAGLFVFCAGLAFFPFLFLLFLDYRVYEDTARIKRVQALGSVPCILLLALLLINLKTGWVYTVGADNIYHLGALFHAALAPGALYILLSLIRVRRINVRLIPLGVLLIVARVALQIWSRDISSTPFMFALLLACTHMNSMNRLLIKEAP